MDESKSSLKDEKSRNHTDVAIIGIGLKIADASNLKDYWRIFEDNIDCIRAFPEERKKQVDDFARVFLEEGIDPAYYDGTYLDRIDEFDNEFFKISPREAQVMGPPQRLLLETICETFDNAGYSQKNIKGSKTGVFIGYSTGSFKDNYLVDISFNYPELLKYSMVGNMPAVLPARASHILDLHGPDMIIDTACSSSLVAVNEACESIRSQTSTMAIAGGVKLNMLPIIAKDIELGFESNDNKTRTFEAGASGTSIGEGVACILLKSLDQAKKDHDHIYAVIKGKSINHDGTAMGITAPNPVAQTNVIVDALNDAGISPDDVDYIETHGTATILGDPIELQGLKNAFGQYTSRKQFCALSASKSNLGHLYECAGMAAIIKAVAAIQYKRIPGMKNFLQPNVMLGLCDSPFYINTKSKDWTVPEGKLRTCGVSAFGISGTNCHLVMQEYKEEEVAEQERLMDIVCISAKTQEAFVNVLKRYEEYLEKQEVSLNRFAVNVNCYKMHYQIREAIVFENKEQLLERIKELLEKYENEEVKPQEGSEVSARFIEDQLEDCNEILSHYNETLDGDDSKAQLRRLLNELGKEYMLGNEIDWNLLYDGFDKQRIVLPCYPFKKNRFWLPVDQAVKKKKESSLKEEIPLFYKRSFILKENEPMEAVCDSCLLIKLHNDECSQLVDRLGRKFKEVRVVDIDERMIKVLDTEVYMNNLIKRIDFSTVTHIVFRGFSSNAVLEDSMQLKEFEKMSLMAVTALYKCLASSMWKNNKIRIVQLMNTAFLVTGKEVNLHPEYASVFGFCKAMNREFKNLLVTSIDYDEETDMNSVVDEICSGSNLDIVSYRNGKRYIEKLEEAEIPYENKETMIRNNGVYLITGGASGIGFETAMELLRRGENLTLILINRASVPEESQWETILKSEKETKLAKRIANLMELKKYANHVEYYASDIANQEAVHSIIKEVNEKYGKINGVFHAAGIGGGTNLDGLNEERIMKMISPKILGAYILDHETRDQGLDFFVMFSSISTIFSSSDLPDYIAGNIFMDSYCEYRRRTEQGVSLTVNWATWSETGMSVEHNFTMDTLFKAIKTKEGIKGLFAALHHGSGNVVIGRLNLDDRMGLLLKKYSIQLSQFIKDKIALLEEKLKTEQEEAKQAAKSYTGGYGTVERKLCDICCKVLGYQEINIFDNFFELGADSIMLGYIFNEVDAVYPNMVKVTDLFSRPTVKALAEYLIELGADKMDDQSKLEENVSKEQEKEVVVEKVKEEESDYSDQDIAIIGVGMNMPNASSLDEYWDVLSNGVNVVREMPEEHRKEIEAHIQYMRRSKEPVKFRKCGYLDEINKFDYGYFGMSPREASLIEPSNRLFLQCCASAIDDAGYGRDGIKGSQTGVFLGYSANIGNAYARLLYETDDKLFNASLSLNQVSMSASKVAYLFDLKGPSMVIDTACSSSLVAMHMACEQLRNGDCEMALAGGASIALSPVADKFSVGFESQEEKTRAFADESTGTAVGEGVGVVLLKPLKKALEDKDAIYAVIKGSAINQDGSSFGIAAPNYEAQCEAIEHAWKNAGVSPLDISYIEAHGTGTALGDPIEIRGITEAFDKVTDKKQICGIGSLKTNIGHLNEASGVSGIIKILLMLRYKIIPPSLNLLVPNRNIDFLESPMYVVSRKTPLKPKGKHILVGINGFGMSGTNCHMILEEPPVQKVVRHEEAENHFLAISAKSTTALKNLLVRYLDYVKRNPDQDLETLCYNINVGRHHSQYRLAFLFADQKELQHKLETLIEDYPYATKVRDCYSGRFAIVPENKKDRFQYEITLVQQQQLTKDAEKYVADYMQNKDTEEISRLLEAYVTGAMVEWLNLYEGEYNKLHIPTYPYDRSHCWYKVKELTEEQLDKSNEGDSSVLNADLDSYFYEKRFVQHEEEDHSFLQKGDTVVVLCNEGKTPVSLAASLKGKGINVILATRSEEYKQMDSNTYQVPSTIEGYQSFFEQLKEDKNEVKCLIHMKSIYDRSSEGSDEIAVKIDEGFFDMISLINGMSKAHFNQNMEIVIIANQAYAVSGKEAYLVPENAMMLSMGKVIEMEYTNINCRAIDIDGQVSADMLADELFVKSNLYLTAYRDKLRYGEELNEADIDETCDCLFRENGVYIVTGGTSGIGKETVKYLSRQVNAHINVLSRRGESVADLTEYVEQQHCTIDYYACDVGDYEKVKQVYESIKQKYGKVNGIIHSAGISGAGYILRKERASYLNVFNPKVYGAWNLDNVSKEDHLDFMVLYSSAVTDSGEAGQSDYVAANSYLDAFTDYRNALGRKTMTVNWVSWKETGMSVVHGINVDSATKAITTKEGIDALDRFIRSSKHRVTIGQFNVDDNFLALSQYSKNLASKEIQTKIGTLMQRRQEALSQDVLSDGNRNFAQIKDGKLIFIPKSDKAGKSKKVSEEIKLTGDYRNHYTKTEKAIGKIYSEILGYEEVNVFDNFFEMGGDSVMLSEMHSYIDELYPEYITVADLFEYTSVRVLAEYIDSKNVSNEVATTKEVQEEEIGQSLCYPATEAQKRIYNDSRINKDKQVYNNPFVSDISGFPGDVDAILNQIVARHEILRTYFCFDKAQLMQKVLPELKIEVTYVDVDDVDQIDFNQYLHTFNLKQAPLFHATVFRGKNNEKILMFDVHHILLDGFSSSMVQREFLDLACGKQLEEAVYQYRDYVAFEKEFLNTDEVKDMKRYWSKRLLTYEEKKYALKADASKAVTYESIADNLDEELEAKLRELSKKAKVSLFSVFYSALTMAMAVQLQHTDIAVIVPVLNRYRPRFRKIMGLFVNMIPMRNQIDVASSLKEYLTRIGKSIEQDLSNQFCDYNDIMAQLKQDAPDKSYGFDCYFDFEDDTIKKITDRKEVTINQVRSKENMDLSVRKYNNNFKFELTYKSNLYEKETMKELMQLMQQILTAYCNNELDVITVDEIMKEIQKGEM